MKKNHELYFPILNIAGIFITLWLLTIINIKPVAPVVTQIQADTNRTTVDSNKYAYGFFIAHKPIRKSTKMMTNF